MPGTTCSCRRHPSRGLAPLLVLVLLPASKVGLVCADVTPMLNASVVASASRVGPLLDTQVQLPPTGPPSAWNGSVFSNANDPPYIAFGTMSISFSAATTGLRVFTGGSSTVSGEGVNHGVANLNYFFIADRVQDASFSVTLTLHDLPGHAGALLFPFEVQGDVPYLILAQSWGTNASSMRIPPGTWLVHAWADFDSTAATGTSPAFSIDANFADCPSPLVTSQPTAQTKQVGSTSSFTVGVAGGLPTSSVTTATAYQWRRDLVNLTDGGRISGATTSQLVIANTWYADSGYYDVVVTQGATVETSSLAKLTVVPSSSDVGPAAIGGVEMAPPAPNPAHGRTRVSFALPAAMSAGLDVLDVTGRVVKTLLPHGLYEAGPRTAEWDGADEHGSHAAPGVYLLRLRAGTSQLVRRVVNLASN
jgi:hypothetical protein